MILKGYVDFLSGVGCAKACVKMRPIEHGKCYNFPSVESGSLDASLRVRDAKGRRALGIVGLSDGSPVEIRREPRRGFASRSGRQPGSLAKA